MLGGHGPNLGIGGGRFAATEGVLSALTWLASGVAPGVWLVLTGWSPEYLPDLDGGPMADTRCETLALALTPASDDSESRLILQIIEFDAPLPPFPPTPEAIAARLESQIAAPSKGPRVIAHEAHAALGSHLDRRSSGRRRRVVLGTDASGRLRVELAAPRRATS